MVSRTKVLMTSPVHSEEAPHALWVVEDLCARPLVHDTPTVQDDDVLGEPLQDGEVLLDEHDGRQLADALEDVSHLA